jgi:Fur family ferric uptake transcriptional regulator
MDKSKIKTTAGKDTFRWFWEALDTYLADKNLKQTQQRRKLIELFLKMNSHVSAEELHEAARNAGHNIGLATIYRTLNLLAEADLVEQKSFVDGRHVYEVNMPGEHHDHLICLDCGAVIEFENEEIEKLQEKIAQSRGFELKVHRLDLFGRCLKKDTCERRV